MQVDEIAGLSWDAIGALAGIAALLPLTIVAIGRIKAMLDQRSLRLARGAEDYSPEVLSNAVRDYVQPFCSAVDPAGRENFRSVHPIHRPLSEALDDALLQADHQSRAWRSGPKRSRGSREGAASRYLLLLADSGMGKTTALINYYATSLRRWKRRTRIALIDLGRPGALERIGKVRKKRETVLLLDALDEDPLSRDNNVGAYVGELMQAAREFRAVVLSCRSQFFASDAEIVLETGIAMVPDHLGMVQEAGVYKFEKLYLVPFSDKQIERFIRMRYRFWHHKARARAREVIGRNTDLNGRPMLLAYIDDLVRKDDYPKRLADAYERIVDAWLMREKLKGQVTNIVALRRFSEQAAVEIYLGATRRGGEHLASDEVTTLAADWQIPLEGWELKGRSLLNRDAAGNHKFAHRSIMEYLFVRTSVGHDHRGLAIEWTDQMLVFASELLPRIEWFSPFMNGVKTTFTHADVEKRDRVATLLVQLICRHLTEHPNPFRAYSEEKGEVTPAHYLIALLSSLMRAESKYPFMSKLVALDLRKPNSAVSLILDHDGPTGFQIEIISAENEASLRPLLTHTESRRSFEVVIEQKISLTDSGGVLKELSVPLWVNGVGSIFFQFLHGGSIDTSFRRLEEVLKSLPRNQSGSGHQHRLRYGNWADAVKAASSRYTIQLVAPAPEVLG